MEIEHSKPVPPFVKFCAANIPMVFDDSLSYYEALCALWKWLQTDVIDVINNNATATEAYRDEVYRYKQAVDQLHDYVENYFANLDVQEEINNKLDDMVESGQLSDLIAQYIGLGALVTYDTLDDLISSTNVSNGCKCKTLGKNTKGDGFGAYYTIATTGDILLDNGLYATLVPNFGGNNYYSYYDDITTVVERHYNTTCYITTIPYTDSDNEVIEPYIAKCNESPLRYAQKNETSLTINASLGDHTLIHDGEVITDKDSENPSLPDSAQYLAITDDRNFISFKANTTTYQNMIAGGAKEAWLVFYQIIINSVKPDWDEIDTEWTSDDSHIATNRHPRQCIGVKADKTIIILTTDGRRPTEYGLTSDECADILLNLGCTNAWNLDGGGSTSTSINGYKLNANIDQHYTADREAIKACLNVKKPTIDEELGKVNSYIGRTINQNNKKLVELINTGIVKTYSNSSLNNLTDTQQLTYGIGLTNAPSGFGYVQTIPCSDENAIGTYAKQIHYERDRGRIFTRSLVNNAYKDWVPSDGYKTEVYDRGATWFSLSADDTYEDYTFDNPAYNNNVSYLNFFTVKSDNKTINFNGDVTKVKLTIIFDLRTTSVAGSRYVKIKQGTADVNSSNKQWQFTGGSYLTNSLMTTCVVDATKDIKIQFYGKAGDQFRRFTIIAEQFA